MITGNKLLKEAKPRSAGLCEKRLGAGSITVIRTGSQEKGKMSCRSRRKNDKNVPRNKTVEISRKQ